MQSRITGMAIALRPPAIAIGGQSIDLMSTPPRLQQSAASRSRTGGGKRRGIGMPAFYNRNVAAQEAFSGNAPIYMSWTIARRNDRLPHVFAPLPHHGGGGSPPAKAERRSTIQFPNYSGQTPE